MSVELHSTRDETAQNFSYADALIEGIASDGGLFTPVDLPVYDKTDLAVLSEMTYPELFTAIKSQFSDEPADVMSELAEASFSEDVFWYRPEHKDGKNTTPLRHLAGDIFILGTAQGPTGAFKDLAMQPLARELDIELERRGQTLDILSATSGDTGPAAQNAVRNLGRLSIVTLSPKDRVGAFPLLQMADATGGNVTNVRIEGTFDDCQDLVKAVAADKEFADWGTMNSINIGRVSAQIAYYFSACFQARAQTGAAEIDVVVPTGNFGNVLAGHYAKKMGAPIRNLIVATNENSVMHDAIQRGMYHIKPSDQVQTTSSPSIDIGKASNYERLVWEVMGYDASATIEYMAAAKDGAYFADWMTPNTALRSLGFDSGISTAKDRLDTIRWAHKASGAAIDPHTADAVAIARRLDNDGVPKVCLETALPIKFESTVVEALGDDAIERPAHLDRIAQLALDTSVFIDIPNDQAKLKEVLRRT